eukprot:7963475-Pyramimonas_sp.AAC.1
MKPYLVYPTHGLITRNTSPSLQETSEREDGMLIEPCIAFSQLSKRLPNSASSLALLSTSLALPSSEKHSCQIVPRRMQA